MHHTLCKQRKKWFFFVEWFTVGCQIYMSREDAGGVASRKEKKIASRKRYGVKERLQMGRRKVCKYSLWWVVALQPLQTGMRLLQLREQEMFSICFGKHVRSIAIARSPFLQSDPRCTVGFAWMPLRHHRLPFAYIVMSFYITVASCLFVLMRLLRNCPQGHGAAVGL